MEEEELLALPSSKASSSNPIRDWSDDDAQDDEDCRIIEVHEAILATPISYSFWWDSSSADPAAQVGVHAPLAAEPRPPPAPRVKTGKKPFAKKAARKKKGPPQIPTGPLSGARTMTTELG